MFMLKKMRFITWLLMIFFCNCSPSEAAKEEKYHHAELTNLSAYQLGMEEFVIKLHGKNLPEPAADFSGNSMFITLPDTKAKNINKLNSSMKDLYESVPSVVNFSAENISEDERWRVEILIEADRPMKFKSGSKNYDGYSLRIKVEEEKNNFVKFEPTKKAANSPESFLPFRMSEKLNMEFRDAELRDVFRLIMETSGKNVIIDNSFPKDIVISLSLIDVEAGEILNYLMNQYDIACCLAGNNTIAFGTRESLYKLSGEKIIKSFRIAYADLAAVGTMLKNLAALTDTEYTQDDRMRTVHINTNPAKMRVVEDVITRLDVPAQQVMIRASIFEFNDSAMSDVQTAINAVYDKWTFASDPYSSTGLMEYVDRTYSQGRSTFDRYITASFQAIENKGKGRTLANPSVIAVDGQEATISLKQEVLYSKGYNEKGNIEWDSEEVGPELKITPRIEENGYVYLDINITTGDYLGKDTDGNIQTTTREVTTKIRVRDGMPFVIGGLNQDSHIVTTAKIPLIGDIPLLGELFKWKNDEHNKTQAVMIVTPYILN